MTIDHNAAAERRMVEILAWVALMIMIILLTVGAVKLFWSWPVEPILQILR